MRFFGNPSIIRELTKRDRKGKAKEVAKVGTIPILQSAGSIAFPYNYFSMHILNIYALRSMLQVSTFYITENKY